MLQGSAAAQLLTRASGLSLISASAVLLLIGAGYLAPGAVLLGAIGFGTGVLAAIRPAAALIAIPATIGLVYAPIRHAGLQFSPAEILILASAAGIMLREAILLLVGRGRPLGGRLQLIRHEATRGFAPAALVLVVAGIVSLFTLADPTHRSESLRLFRWVIVEPVLYALLARYYLRSAVDRKIAGVFFVGAAAAISLYGLTMLGMGAGLGVEGVTRISSTYPHPNALALYLERPVVFAFALAITAPRSSSLRWLALTMVSMLALILTFSRGALLGVGIAAVLVSTLSRRRQRAKGLMVIGAALGVVLTSVAAPRMLSLFGGGSGSLRVAIWDSAVAMIRDHPIFGVGLDQFLYQYAPRYVAPEAWPERFTSHPHDLVLDLWLSLGIIGFAAAGLYMVSFIRMTRQIVSHDRSFGLAAIGGIMVGGIHGLIDNGYFLPDLALTFWFLTVTLELEAGATRLEGEEGKMDKEDTCADPSGWRSGFHRIASLRRAR
jgi:putative inorganic carbon (HCO3(-)) transporter